MFQNILALTLVLSALLLCIPTQSEAQSHAPHLATNSAWDRMPSKVRHFSHRNDQKERGQPSTNLNQPTEPSGTDLYNNALSHAELLDAQGRTHRVFFNPPKQQRIPELPSALEAMYQDRIVDNVRQFGYDLFGVPTSETETFLSSLGRDSYSIPSGSVADDFILDIGDQLEIVFTGQRHDRNTYTINSQGQLLIQDFPPIPAAGRSIGQVRISVEAAARNLHNTQAYLSLATVRQIGVLVVGHVRRPKPPKPDRLSHRIRRADGNGRRTKNRHATPNQADT